MNAFIKTMTEKAAVSPCVIGFPEAGNTDILKTAEQVVGMGIGTPLLMGNRDEIEKAARESGVNTQGFTYFDFTSRRTGSGWRRNTPQNSTIFPPKQ